MHTDVQRTHRIVVGVGVAIVAAAGISTVAVNVHRTVMARGSAPALAATGTSAANDQTPANAPPPQAQGPTLPSPAANASAASDPSANQPAPATVPKVTSQGSSVDSVRRSRDTTDETSNPPAPGSGPVSRGPSAPVALNGSGAVVSAIPGASSLIGDESQYARNAAGSADAVAGEADPRNPSAAGAGPTVGEVPSTVQARAAGGDAENSDRMITSTVKSQIAASMAGHGANLDVTTVNGVVILTGTASSSDVLDHVKQSVQLLKDVKGVDATAVRISGS